MLSKLLAPASRMRLFGCLSIIFCACAANAQGNSKEGKGIEGRWDMTVNANGELLPSWLEVSHSGNNRLFGRFVGFGGSARPVSKINFENGHMIFSVPPQWEKDDYDFVLEADLQGDSLVGFIVTPSGEKLNWVGHRAPALVRKGEPIWDKPIQLFDGKSLKGWHATGKNQWVAKNGILRSDKSGSNLISDRKFSDFKLHVEFRYPEGSNSGVYLRGRYEIQVEDSYGKEPGSIYLGGLYGFISPLEMVAKKAGEWQSFDITLMGRRIELVANGKKIIYTQEIPGITGGALDSYEGLPGPIMFQGDHGPIEYRNIIITPAK
ncbi:MAG TPA: DUF1080 domain-containing protein [Phnomibacter sp.]|nr:DUF1080 domain-containing protein [Phnomibacter sp.]